MDQNSSNPIFYSSSSDLHNSGLIIFSLFLIKNNKLDSNMKCTPSQFDLVVGALQYFLCFYFVPWQFASHPSLWINRGLNELHIKLTLFVLQLLHTEDLKCVVVVWRDCWIMFRSETDKERQRVHEVVQNWTEKNTNKWKKQQPGLENFCCALCCVLKNLLLFWYIQQGDLL